MSRIVTHRYSYLSPTGEKMIFVGRFVFGGSLTLRDIKDRVRAELKHKNGAEPMCLELVAQNDPVDIAWLNANESD